MDQSLCNIRVRQKEPFSFVILRVGGVLMTLFTTKLDESLVRSIMVVIL